MNINVLHFATLHNTIIYKCIQTLTSSRKEKKTESKLDKVKNLHKLKENLSKEEENNIKTCIQGSKMLIILSIDISIKHEDYKTQKKGQNIQPVLGIRFSYL